MYISAYKQLFWGFFIAIVHIRIQGFDLLVDVIGYALICAALRKLAIQHQHFLKARLYSFMLMPVSLVSIMPIFGSIDTNMAFNSLKIVLLIVGQLISLMQFFMLYWICQAMIEVAQQKSLEVFAAQVKSRWKYYCYTFLFLLFVTPLTLHLDKQWLLLYGAFGVLAFIGLLLLLFTFRKAVQQLGQYQNY